MLPASSGNGQPGEQGAPSSGGAGLGQQDPSSGDGQQATAPPKPPGGKPGYYELIPEMIDVALKYLQIKGWGAQKRRRNDNCSTAGVESKDLRDHLMDNVAGLRIFVMQSAAMNGKTVSGSEMYVEQAKELFLPPNFHYNSSNRYHGFVNAKVPRKRNDESEDCEDFHTTAAQVQYGREFAFEPEFEKHCARLSGDGIYKQKVGVLAVSWHHQVYRRYLVDDSPNYNYHNFPFPGYLLAPLA